MEPAIEERPHNRRRFLGNLGKTLALGLGVSLVASETALAACDGIICYPEGPNCRPDYCNGVLCSGQCFHCVGCGEDTYYCTSHACTTWCMVSVC